MYPLIDLTRPVRLTKYGKEKFGDVEVSLQDNICIEEKYKWFKVGHIDRSFNRCGFYLDFNPRPSIENIPEEIKMVDWTKEVIDLETGEVMRVLCTDRPSPNGCHVVMLYPNGDFQSCSIGGKRSTVGNQRYGNRKPDSEPPEEIFKIWRDGFSTIVNAKQMISSSDEFKKSLTYKNYKNKIITVEDV